MSAPKKAINEQQPAQTVDIQTGESVEKLRSELNAKVEELAYYNYLSHAQDQGKGLADWLGAEAKLMGKSIQVRESGPWFHCNCEVQGIENALVQVALDPTQVLIHLSGADPAVFPQDGSTPIYFWAKWPQEVDPSTAAAYVKDGKLTIEVKKTNPPADNPVVEAPIAPKH